MENKVLTSLQIKILDLVFSNRFGKRGFFLTGGTALSGFYLEHRYSDDLDFFTRKQDSLEEDFKAALLLLNNAGFSTVQHSIGADGMVLFVNDMKVEFHRDVPAVMAPSKMLGDIVIDSFEDIAVNKICALPGRPIPEPKDFCDIYFILKESKFTLDYLLTRAKEKEAMFDREEGILMFSTTLLGAKNLPRLPRMIKPLNMNDLQTFLVPKAEEIITRLRPQGH